MLVYTAVHIYVLRIYLVCNIQDSHALGKNELISGTCAGDSVADWAFLRGLGRPAIIVPYLLSIERRLLWFLVRQAVFGL